MEQQPIAARVTALIPPVHLQMTAKSLGKKF